MKLKKLLFVGLVLFAVSPLFAQADDAALIAEAQVLTKTRNYGAALAALNQVSMPSGDLSLARFQALSRRYIVQKTGLDAVTAQAASDLDRYPQDYRFVEAILRFEALQDIPTDSERSLVRRCLRALPALIDEDPILGALAVPCMSDREAAKKMLAVYRSKPGSAGIDAQSIPAALELGLIDGTEAVKELFAHNELDWALVSNLQGLLANDEAAGTAFDAVFKAWTGTLARDADNDGWDESWTTYNKGLVTSYRYDPGQDGVSDWLVNLVGGLPATAVFNLDGRTLSLTWEKYPSVSRVQEGDNTYIYGPGVFAYRPLILKDGEEPRRDTSLRLTSVNLSYYASSIERPGRVIPGSVETIDVVNSIPFRSTETLNGKTVVVTSYKQGLPFLERVDFDGDGRMETLRHYKNGMLVSSESDWDGDGKYETAEIYNADGSVTKTFDLDGDGVRETKVVQ
jgi:hypothetical protein